MSQGEGFSTVAQQQLETVYAQVMAAAYLILFRYIPPSYHAEVDMQLSQGLEHVLPMLHQALAPVEPELVEHNYAAVAEHLVASLGLPPDAKVFVSSIDQVDLRKLCNVAIYLLYLRRRLLGGPPE